MQNTVSKAERPTTFEPSSRRHQRNQAQAYVTERSGVLEFSIAGVLTAALAISAAALLYHGSGSNVALGSALGCLAGAVALQISARRRLRDELIDDARRDGAEDPQADGRARLARWLER